MKNRTLIWLSSVLIGGMLVILAAGLLPSFWPQTGKYLTYNQVRGIAIKHQNKLYMLNFKQQKMMISLLNQLTPLENVPDSFHASSDFDAIIIYPFNQSEIRLTPRFDDHKNLFFAIPKWNATPLRDQSQGQLYTLIHSIL